MKKLTRRMPFVRDEYGTTLPAGGGPDRGAKLKGKRAGLGEFLRRKARDLGLKRE